MLAEFDAAPQWPDSTPEYYIPRLEAAGLSIEKVEEWQGQLIFHNVGAIVYYLKAVPWFVPDFSVETHSGNLMRLQGRLEGKGKLVFEARKYLIEARSID